LLLDALPDSERKAAAAGWGGDALRVYQRGQDLAWVGLSRWDSEQDATEFAGAFAKAVPLRRVGFDQQPLTGEPRMTWRHAGAREIHVERRGDRVLILEGFDPQAGQAIREALSFGSPR
jgi:hypothetical protein